MSKNKTTTNIRKITICIIIIILYFIAQICLIKFASLASYHKLTISATLISIVICVDIILLFDDDKKIFQNNEELYDKLEFYWLKKQAWLKSEWLWQYSYYYITGMSLLSSCIVIYISSENINNKTSSIIFYSILSMTLTFLNLLINPFKGAKSYRNAYIRMEKDILDCINNKMDINDLPKEFEICENEITNGIF